MMDQLEQEGTYTCASANQRFGQSGETSRTQVEVLRALIHPEVAVPNARSALSAPPPGALKPCRPLEQTSELCRAQVFMLVWRQVCLPTSHTLAFMLSSVLRKVSRKRSPSLTNSDRYYSSSLGMHGAQFLCCCLPMAKRGLSSCKELACWLANEASK